MLQIYYYYIVVCAIDLTTIALLLILTILYIVDKFDYLTIYRILSRSCFLCNMLLLCRMFSWRYILRISYRIYARYFCKALSRQYVFAMQYTLALIAKMHQVVFYAICSCLRICRISFSKLHSILCSCLDCIHAECFFRAIFYIVLLSWLYICRILFRSCILYIECFSKFYSMQYSCNIFLSIYI